MIDIKAMLDLCADKTERTLEKYVPISDVRYGVIHDAMRYSLLAGGKRLRPFLVMEFARLAAIESGAELSAAEMASLPYACAVEMIHTYSLIHDDLPCMDNDDLRRGKPTNHKVYGETNALLAGDALLTRAFGVIASNTNVDANISCRAAALLSECAGADGMIGGQVLDIMAENEAVELSELEELQALKTGELIRCASLLGCFAGGASEKLICASQKYAQGIGRAFQIIDDILDVVGNEETLGKPIGSDEKKSKATFVTHMGIDKARQYAVLLTNEAKAAIEAFDGSDVLCELAEFLLTREK